MRKTLIILSPGFPKDEADSTCIPDRQIFVRVLKETYPGIDLVVLTFQYPYKANVYWWNGVKVIALGGKNKSGLYRRLTWVRAWRKLKKLNNETRLIGLLSFWLDECAFIGHKFAKKYALKHYSWLLGQDARPGNKYVGLIKPNGDNLVALSDYLVNEFTKNYNIVPQHVVPGAIDPALFKTVLPERDIDVLGVGSLIPLKQYHLFIETIKFLKGFFPDIKAMLCGKGPEMERLKKMARFYQLEKNMVFKGELSHPEILVHMQRSKILLHPSNYEGFGIVLLEALYAGAHVVSFVRPMEAAFSHHHVVDNIDKMNDKALALLTDTGTEYQQVLVNDMQQVAGNIINLFE